MDLRHSLLVWLFELSVRPYALLKRKTPWGLTRDDLLTYPIGSFGRAIGQTLVDNDFELMPKLESHDVLHVLTGTGTDVPSEVSLQFLMAGNGKRSLYLAGVVLLGAIVLPDQWPLFRSAWRRGRSLEPFHHIDAKALLRVPLVEVQRQWLRTRIDGQAGEGPRVATSAPWRVRPPSTMTSPSASPRPPLHLSGSDPV